MLRKRNKTEITKYPHIISNLAAMLIKIYICSHENVRCMFFYCEKTCAHIIDAGDFARALPGRSPG